MIMVNVLEKEILENKKLFLFLKNLYYKKHVKI